MLVSWRSVDSYMCTVQSQGREGERQGGREEGRDGGRDRKTENVRERGGRSRNRANNLS